jgi:aminopeptidase
MYKPSKKIIKKYADVLVKFALNSGEGIKKGEVVQCVVPDVAKPMLMALHVSILEAGGHPMLKMFPTGINKDFYKFANDDQLIFFPKKYTKARVDTIDHSIGILAEDDLYELKSVDPKKIIKSMESKNIIRDWFNDKEYTGKFTWTLALYGTEAMANEAGLTLKEYWGEIIKACFLDKDDPIAHWKKIAHEQKRIKNSLNKLMIDRIHIKGAQIDLWMRLGEKRKFMGGSGRNIPSFEIFTSPDWRGTNGKIYFNQPLYRYGNLIEGIKLEFKNGKVVKARAKKGERLLLEMLKRPNADKVGEFSLTDARFSKITKFMANTLFDENVGGKFGNTHIAVGMSYKDAYDGSPKEVKKSEWKKMGFNDSGEHCDIISTEDRVVTAILKNGEEKIIYKNGRFVV